MAGGEAQGGGFVRNFGREGRMVDVDADAGYGYGIDKLDEDAGGLFFAEHDVVGPAEIGMEIGGLGDGLSDGQAQG